MNKAAIFSFTAGAALGATAAWIYLKKKYEKLSQEEINSAKEAFKRLYKQNNDESDTDDDEDDEAEEAPENETVSEYISIAEEYSVASTKDLPKNDLSTDTTRPYVIAPDEFGAIEEYDQISLTYFADQVLADDNDEVVHNVSELVGYNSLKHFGEYEDDSVFVRNDRYKCDYEILLDTRTYAEFLEEHPYKAERV